MSQNPQSSESRPPESRPPFERADQPPPQGQVGNPGADHWADPPQARSTPQQPASPGPYGQGNGGPYGQFQPSADERFAQTADGQYGQGQAGPYGQSPEGPYGQSPDGSYGRGGDGRGYAEFTQSADEPLEQTRFTDGQFAYPPPGEQPYGQGGSNPDYPPPQLEQFGDAQPVVPGGQAPRIEVQERLAFSMNGFLAWVLVAAFWVIAVIAGIVTIVTGGVPVVSIVMIALALVMQTSVTVVQQGQAKVLQFFGRYVGTVRRTGPVLTIPWTQKRNISTKIENFETNQLKVNDADGNPINIAAIVVWQVADTAKATFAVEHYGRFVEIQAEAALRHIASQYPYDNAADGGPTLRESADVVAAQMAEEVNNRVHLAGVSIIETRISTLAYAPEIAQAMLQRQQASAIIAAREKILEGAVGMVDGALKQLEASVRMDDHHRAEMVSNLLVVLCSDAKVTPVVNTGSSMRNVSHDSDEG